MKHAPEMLDSLGSPLEPSLDPRGPTLDMLDLQGAPPLTGKDSASAQSIVPCADEFEYGEDLAVDCATGGSMRTAPSPSPPLLFALANTSKYVSGPVCRKSVSGIEGRQMLSESQMFRGIVQNVSN